MKNLIIKTTKGDVKIAIDTNTNRLIFDVPIAVKSKDITRIKEQYADEIEAFKAVQVSGKIDEREPSINKRKSEIGKFREFYQNFIAGEFVSFKSQAQFNRFLKQFHWNASKMLIGDYRGCLLKNHWRDLESISTVDFINRLRASA
jgi:hypothetical protein